MKYMGSKARFAGDILKVVLGKRTPDQWYVEPFAGGMNVIEHVAGPRIANDLNPYLVAMWDAVVNRGWVPEKVTRDYYNDVRRNKNLVEPHVVGWVGFGCSYSGKFFGGYAGETSTKTGTVRDYQAEAIRSVRSQVAGLRGVEFRNCDYRTLDPPKTSVIYCDPPYEGTTQYAVGFDHVFFWRWVRRMGDLGHTVFVSGYAAPKDFECLWEKPATSSLSANGKCGGNKTSTERLFAHRSVL